MNDGDTETVRDRNTDGQFTRKVELDEVLDVMEPLEPYGTNEVGDILSDKFGKDFKRRTTYHWLTELRDHGKVRKKKIDAKRNIWIRLPNDETPSTDTDDSSFELYDPDDVSTHIVGEDGELLCGSFELATDASTYTASNQDIADRDDDGDSCGNCYRLWRLKTGRSGGDGWDDD